MMKRVLSVFLAAVILFMLLTACFAENQEGIIKELPSKIDLRNYNGKNYVTPVKTQKFGDCWTFSLAGFAEIAYLYANDLGVPAGEVNKNVDFSEKYIACYLYHGITKDDVDPGRVRASQIGEGFDPGKAESTDKNAVYGIGGEFVHCCNLFGCGFGPVDESVSINGDHPFQYGASATDGWTLPLTAEYRCVPSSAYLRNSLVLPCPASVDASGSYKLSDEGLDAIKSEIIKGHGVSLAFCSSGCTFNSDHRAAYYSGSLPADHAVTVVGYNDDFPKEYFTVDGNNDSMPPENGAFIIKNSWGILGDVPDDIDDGYFYLSYYDHNIISPLSYIFDKSDAVRHTESNFD